MKTFALSARNHFQFGYNSEWFNFRQSPNDKWRVRYGRCQRAVGDFRSECILNAREIYETNGQSPIAVLFSGGVDSEVTLRSFLLAQVPVRTYILRFKGGLNQHDTVHAIKACEQLGVQPQFIDLDILKFWENQLWDFAEPTYCISPQLATTMWLMDQVDEIPVLGSGECLFARRSSDPNNSRWVLLEKERIAAWYRYFQWRARPGCPGFFQFTPEVMLAYIRDPLVQKLFRGEFTKYETSAGIKLEMYQQHFPVESRSKFTGYEHLQDQDYMYRQQLIRMFPQTDQIFETEVTELEKALDFNFT